MKLPLLPALAALCLAAACLPAEEPADTSASVPTPVKDAGMKQTPETPDVDEAPTSDTSCLAEIGETAAAQLVDQCIQMSPATRPPCNAANSCDMIRDEIARGCAFGDTSGNPDFCADYE